MKKYSRLFYGIIMLLCTTMTMCSQESSKTARYALHEAAAAGQSVRVASLLDRGMNVNARNRDKETPIHVATKNGHAAVVALLINRQSKLNARDKDGNTPLHHACHQGNIQLVQLLINHKAQVGARNKNWEMPPHMAIKNGHVAIVEILLNHDSKIMNKADYSCRPFFHDACYHGQRGVVQFLIQRYGMSTINVLDGRGNLPLYYAIDGGHVDIYMMLYAEASDDESLRAFCGAKPFGEPVIGLIWQLLRKGAKINSRGPNGRTPLHCAAEAHNWEIGQLLLEHGADVNAQATIDLMAGATPLHIVARSGDFVGFYHLTKYSPNLGARTRAQETPLHLAAQSGHKHLVTMLCQLGAQIDARTSLGKTPLHSATFEGSVDVVEFLVGEGADVNARDNDGMTPLHLAAARGHAVIVGQLLRYGADAYAQDSYRRTPLASVLVYFAPDKDKEVIKSFLQWGVDYSKQKKRLDESIPEYTEWIKEARENLLSCSALKALPRDLQGLLLDFIVLRTPGKRKKESAHQDDAKGPKRQKRS